MLGCQRVARTRVRWFFGFTSLLVNDQGELLTCRLTPGNIDDRRPVPGMVQGLFGKLIGDKGYSSQALVETLLQYGIELITRSRAP